MDIQRYRLINQININFFKYIHFKSYQLSHPIMRKLLQLCRCPRLIVACLSSPSHEDIKLAIKKLQIDKLEELLDEGAPIRENSETILHFAVLQNKLQAIEYICEREKELIDERNDDGDTAFMLALFGGQKRIIKYLITVSNVNIRDNNGNTPTMIAAANGNVQTLQLLLENPKTNVTLKNFEGQNALHRAAYHGELEVIKMLIKRTRLKLGQTDRKGNNSLHLACMGVSLKCARYIVSKVKESKRLLEEVNKEGKKPIDILEEVIEKINNGKESEKLQLNLREIVAYIKGD